MAPSVQRRKVSLTPSTRVPCSNAAKTPNPLKLPDVPQTNEPISAASRPKLRYCKDMWGRYCYLTGFSDCRYVPHLRRYSPTKLCDGAQMAIFWVLHFQRAACSTFQTCIQNSNKGHTMCRSMVDIQFPTAEIRRRKKERRKHRAKI